MPDSKSRCTISSLILQTKAVAGTSQPARCKVTGTSILSQQKPTDSILSVVSSYRGVSSTPNVFISPSAFSQMLACREENTRVQPLQVNATALLFRSASFSSVLPNPRGGLKGRYCDSPSKLSMPQNMQKFTFYVFSTIVILSFVLNYIMFARSILYTLIMNFIYL